MSRLPVFHDDRSFREQTERMFREMEEKMGFHHPQNPAANLGFQDFMGGGARWPPSFDDSSFFQLRPAGALTHQDVGGAGLQSEVLDDNTARALFVDIEPARQGDGHGGRVFRMSFDARQYDPGDVSVRCEDGCLLVDAKHSEHGATHEFQRRIQLPHDVDPAKLTSTLSADGILTVEAPVPPRYQAIVGPSADLRAQKSAVQARVSPVTAGGAFHDAAGGRGSPFSSGGGGRNGGFMPVSSAGVRNSPVSFSSLAPVTALTPATLLPGQTAGIDVPRFTTDPVTGQRRLELVLELGRPFTADDVVVRVDGRRLTVDARHETTDQQGRVSTSTTQKQFDVDEHLDEATVQATMRQDGSMIITAYTTKQ